MNNLRLNEEFLIGFVEGLMSEYEESLGPYKSDLADYNIAVKEENGIFKISIPFAIISDSRADLETYFELTRLSTIEAFRLKVELAVEEIIRHIKSFRDNPGEHKNRFDE